MNKNKFYDLASLKLQCYFFDYLSYSEMKNDMIGRKNKIYRLFKLSEREFDELLWRANRVLFYQSEYISRKSSDDVDLKFLTAHNYHRQLSYFNTETYDILYNKEDVNEDYLKEECLNHYEFNYKFLKKLINNANFPELNEVEDRLNSGTYFKQFRHNNLLF